MGDDTRKVAPVDPVGGEPSRPRPVGSVALAALAGIVLLLMVTDPATEQTAVTTTATTEPTTTLPLSSRARLPTPVRARTLRDMIPEASGRLHVIEGDSDGTMELLTWEGELGVRPSLFPPGSGFHFDASQRLVAYLDPAPTLPGSALMAGPLTEETPIGHGVSSFAWHAAIPGRLAWMSEEGGAVCWADLDWAESPPEGSPEPVCIPSPGDMVVAFDDHGFLITDSGRGVISRLTAEGEVAGEIPPLPGDVQAVNARVQPDGRILVGVAVAGLFGGFDYLVADPLLDSFQRLPLVEYGLVQESYAAPAPHFPIRHAVLFRKDQESFRVEVVYPDGWRLAGFDLDGRMWDVDWDATGRYLLVPGIVDEIEHVLYVIDTATGEVTRLPFTDWVQDAALVLPALCEDAAAATEALIGRAVPAYTVRTRDPALGTWLFLSAAVEEERNATWALPAFSSASQSRPSPALAVDETAVGLGTEEVLDPEVYGRSHWRQFDGAVISRHCPSL